MNFIEFSSVILSDESYSFNPELLRAGNDSLVFDLGISEPLSVSVGLRPDILRVNITEPNLIISRSFVS